MRALDRPDHLATDILRLRVGRIITCKSRQLIASGGADGGIRQSLVV